MLRAPSAPPGRFPGARSPRPRPPSTTGCCQPACCEVQPDALRLEIRNPSAPAGDSWPPPKGTGDAALTPVAVPEGRPRLWRSRGRPGNSGGWKLPLRRSPLWTPVSGPQHCPAVWGRMLPCWSLPRILGCTLGLQPLGAQEHLHLSSLPQLGQPKIPADLALCPLEGQVTLLHRKGDGVSWEGAVTPVTTKTVTESQNLVSS